MNPDSSTALTKTQTIITKAQLVLTELREAIDELRKVLPTQPTPKKPRPTLYWGIELDPNMIRLHEPVRQALELNPQLVPLQAMHTTLLYVGRKEGMTEEELFVPYLGKSCCVIINGHGVSDKALALQVDQMYFINEEHDEKLDVPTFATKQHVTVALAAGTKPVESVETLMGRGEVVTYTITEYLILEGKLRRF